MRDRARMTVSTNPHRRRVLFQAIRPTTTQSQPQVRQTTLLVTVGLIVVMCLFPPYTTTCAELDAGPEVIEVQGTTDRYVAAESRRETRRYRYDGHLASSRLLVQILLVATLAGNAYVGADE